MTPKTIFGLIVRTFGLLCVAYGIYTLLYGACTLFGLLEYRMNPLAFLVTGIARLAAGLYLLRGAPRLVNFSYPDPEINRDPLKEDEPK
jgi:hypothetical protein